MESKNQLKIVMLAGNGYSTTLMYNKISESFNISCVIIEDKMDSKKFIRNRIRKLGITVVSGQLLFQAIVPKILGFFSKRRIKEIMVINNLSDDSIPENVVKRVPSVNSALCLEILKNEKPDFIIVNGTRIISKKVLNSITSFIVNTHAGITPKYRGVHGGYWALANNDPQNCGVTVHQVDSGIDTGGILYQSNITIKPNDNFVTYPFLQLAEGSRLMVKTITDYNGNEIKTISPKNLTSKLWYHPTLWFYLYNRIFKGVK